MINRQQLGYILTLLSLFSLIIFYGIALFFSDYGQLGKIFLGASLTLIPLLYLTPSVISKQKRGYAALAVISPLHFFFGGVIFLWGDRFQGLWVCFCALTLQTGTILYAYQRREKKKSS